MELATTLIWIVGWVLAVARLTRLTTADALTDGLRDHITNHYPRNDRLQYFAVCPWCQSIWWGAVTVPFLIWQTDVSWWTAPVLVLAASHLIGLMTGLERDDDDVEIVES